MTELQRRHPAQMILGALVVQEELARKTGQMTFAVIAEDAVEWATDLRDVCAEIATDTVYGQERCFAAKADGVVTFEELAEVEGILREIETEAREGRIL